MKMNRRKFFQSFLSLTALACIDPRKLLPQKLNNQPKDIKVDEGPFELMTLHNLQPQHQYTIRAMHGPVMLSCLDRPVKLEPGHAVVITPKEDGGWTQVV